MPRTDIVIAATVLAAGLLAPPARAQDAAGRPIGPPGGLVFELTVDPQDASTLYAATEAGLFKSTTRGAGWHDVSAGLGGVRITELTVDPLDSLRLYGSSARGTFRSRDGGASWEPAFTEPPFDTFTRMVVDPTDGSILFLFVHNTFELYRSRDGGASWDRVNGPQGPPRLEGRSLAISPGDPATIYASGRGDVFVSRDGGDTWEETALNLGVIALAVDAVDPDVAYAVRDGDELESLLVFRTLDGGRTWLRAELGTAPLLAADPRVAGTVYTGFGRQVYRSIDHGATWEPLSELPDFGISALLRVAADGTLYADSRCGLYRHDEGAGWRGANGGLFATEVPGVAVHPANPGILYAAAHSCGPVKSVDGGRRWQRLPFPRERAFSGPEFPAVAFAVAIDPATPRRLFAATTGAFYRSADAGRSWRRLAVGEGDPFGPFDAGIEIAPSDPPIVYLRRQGRLYPSTDGGESFSGSVFGLGQEVYEIAVNPSDGRTAYVSRAVNFGPEARLVKTTNAGRTWRVVGRGLPKGGLVDLAVDPHDPDVLYALPRRHVVRAVYKSVDGGESFRPANDGLEDVLLRALLVDPDLRDTVYAGTSARGVFRSRDGAATWEAMQEVDRRTDVVALAATRTAVYAGLRDGGIVELAKACGDRLATVDGALDVGPGRAPDVAVDGGGRFFVTWTAPGGAALARAWRADGEPLRSALRIGAAGDALPVAAADGPGEVLVAFRRPTPAAHAVRVRAYRIDGKPLGAGRVDAEPQRTKHVLALARSRAGEAVAAWDSVTPDGRSLIRARRLGRGGAALGEAFTVGGGAGRVLAPAVAVDGFGRFAVAWLEAQARELSVRLQRYRTHGTAREGAAVVSAAGATVVESRLAAAAAPAGELAVAWLERGAEGRAELALRWLDAAGQPAASQRLAAAGGDVTGFDLAVDGFGSTLVAWSSADGVRARVYSVTGEARSEELVLGSGSSPAVAVDLAGGAVAVWQRGGLLRAQRLRLDCSP